MKLAAKFARQETEAARLARISRRRIPRERLDAFRRMLNVGDSFAKTDKRGRRAVTHSCVECGRTFNLPMHLGRHRRARHAA